MLQFAMLGPLEVRRGGTPLRLGGPQRRALLAALLLRAGASTTTDHLIDALWGDAPPADALALLQGQIARLRRALEPERAPRADAEVIVSTGGGYLLVAHPDQIDARRFEQLVAAGQQALTTADPLAARELLTEALALWRGPALADVAGHPFALAEAARLEELRLSAREAELEAEIGLGRHREAAADLDVLTAEHPLRERLWALRMIALYRAGRQADALRAFARLRSVLLEELGVDPSREVQDLEAAILTQDPCLDRPLPLRPPAPAAAAPAAGAAPVERPPAADRRPALPPMVAHRPPVPFVGRPGELEVIRRATATVEDGRLQPVLVAGEPGIGKSRTVAEAAREAHSAGAVVLVGRCDDGLAVPYQPFVEALRWYVDHRPADELPGALGPLAGELTRLLPELGDRHPGIPAAVRADPETERYRMFDAVAGWLSAASADQPVVLILEDIHWAARPSLLLLRHLVRSAERLRVTVLATYRDAAIDRGEALSELFADLRRDERTRWLELGGLAEDDVMELIAAASGAELDPTAVSAARQIHDKTEGNPFFVNELLRHLLETGAAHRRDERLVVTTDLDRLGLPEGVRAVVASRAGRLGKRARDLLAAAAAVGVEFPFDLAAAAAGTSTEEALRLLASAEEAGIVRQLADRPSRYRFSHALMRDALYRDLPAARRGLLHLQIARALEERRSTGRVKAAELAHHLVHAAPLDEAAARYSIEAGADAMAMLAYEEAAFHHGRAIQVLEGLDRRDEMLGAALVGLGEARSRAGAMQQARQAFVAASDLAAELGLPDLAADAALAFGAQGVTASIVDHQLVGVLERAATMLPPADSSRRAMVLARLAAELYFSPETDRRAELSEEAVAMARRLGDRRALANALSARHYVLWARGPSLLDERLAIMTELIEVAEELGDGELTLQGHRWGVIDRLETGEIDEVDRHLAAHSAISDTLHQPLYLWWNRVFQAMRALLDGRWDDAERLAQEAWTIGRKVTDAAFQFFGIQVSLVLRERGLIQGLEQGARSLVEQYPAVPAWRCALALYYADLGRPDDAQRELDTIAADDFAVLTEDLSWLPAVTTLAEVACEVGDVDRAARLYELLEPYAGHNVVVGAAVASYGPAAHQLGRLAHLLGRPDDSRRHFDEGLALAERMGAGPAWAHTAARYAAMLESTGDAADRTRAAELRRRAAQIAGALKMTALAAELAAASEPAPPAGQAV